MAEYLNATNLFYALSGGFLPSLLWLWFWLKEDKKHPEPRRAVVAVFLGGMAVVPLAMWLEYRIFIIGVSWVTGIAIYAFIEEVLKYLAAKTAFAKKYFDEPVDALIYMITAALGFASLENTLFVFKSLSDYGVIESINTGNIRFIGATLLHTASSAVVGAAIAFSFFHKEDRRRNVIGGLLLAWLLHFAFNYFIMQSKGGDILKILMPLWLAIIVIIFVFEKIKKIKRS